MPPKAMTGPSAAAIDEAVERLCAPDALTYCRVVPSNQGLSVVLSFNKVEAGGVEGALDVVLRGATLTLTSPHFDEMVRWDEGFQTTIQDAGVKAEVSLGATDGASMSDSRDSSLAGRMSGSLKGLFGGVEAQAEGKAGHRRDAKREQERSHSVTQTATHRPIQLHRPGGQFGLIFDAGPEPDLLFLNPLFNRVTVLECASPSQVDPAAVQAVWSYGGASDSLAGGFRICAATGAWAAITASNNQRILAERLFAKLLPPTRVTADHSERLP